jgi:hypothetical protein
MFIEDYQGPNFNKEAFLAMEFKPPQDKPLDD